jgi:short-subunit dehydrogenase
VKILIVGASRGLGRAFVEGLAGNDDTVIGISRTRPTELQLQSEAKVDWISVDMSNPIQASNIIENQAPNELDVIICNLGIWEEEAFSNSYQFLKSSDEEIVNLIDTNITSTILLLKRLIPRLLTSRRPQIILTGSTSGLPQSGGPEVGYSHICS